MTIRLQLWLALFGALLFGAMPAAYAQSYPNRAINLVVPFAAGGPTDVPARVFGAMFQEKIGQNSVVENKTGGTGTIGVAYVSRSAPDGYTLLANSVADAQNLHFVTVPYHPIDDFSQVGWIVDGPPMVLVVNGALPYKTLADMVADARQLSRRFRVASRSPTCSVHPARTPTTAALAQ
jgi:tripartite-type tricarboxylate transporter receptor subunit TctC